MNTKWWSFGVFAYPKGFQERFPNWQHFGDRKLLEGLWYYDDEYNIHRNYDREIDAILVGCGKLRNEAPAPAK